MQLDCLKLLPYLNKWRKLIIISVYIKHFDSIIIHKIFWLFVTWWLICKLFELCWFMILAFHCTTNKQGQTANVPVLVTFDYACLWLCIGLSLSDRTWRKFRVAWFHFHFQFQIPISFSAGYYVYCFCRRVSIFVINSLIY